MQSELIVRFSDREEYVFPLDQVQAMEPHEGRAWLDAEFLRLECEPLRGSGKVLNADKVVCVAQAAGPQAFADAAWARQFASASKAALDKDVISIDAENTTISF